MTPQCAPKLVTPEKVNKKEFISYRTVESALDGYMTHSFPRRNISVRARLNGFRPALDLIDARLKRAHPEHEDETEKIKKAMLLLFGPEPIGFHSPSHPRPQKT